jgi:predicted DNA-binding transcriptional regulator AlpA
MKTLADFPRPIPIGTKIVAWSRKEMIYAWLEKKKTEPRPSRHGGAPHGFQGKIV